ncbi:hypothetical protein FS837_010326 [Tulasnella sp. UAMH 9824]|nr:hypothetical protein FS837_010326 [Tulasnella sp. UAMH 9824]
MSHHPRKPAGPTDGPSGLVPQLFQIVSTLPWNRCRDDLMQFFLMIKLFDMHANSKEPEVQAKFGQHKSRVITYLDDVKNVRKAKSEEEALKIVSSACDGMRALLKSVNLDPSSHATTKDKWKKAEESKKEFKTMFPVLPGTNATEQEPPILVDVGISVGSKELTVQQTQQLSFLNSFEDWPVSALVSYSLAHPGKLGEREEGGDSGSSIQPFKRQATDATYLRTFYSANKSRTCWIPMDYHVRMRLKDCVARTKDYPGTQIRFISSEPRFVVMAAYDETNGTEVEKIIELDREGKAQLREALKQRELRNVTSRTAPEATRGKGKSGYEGTETPDERAQSDHEYPASGEESEGETRRFDTKAKLRTLEPRSCLLLLGPDPLLARNLNKSKMAT